MINIETLWLWLCTEANTACLPVFNNGKQARPSTQ